jgi:hypothetical protein
MALTLTTLAGAMSATQKTLRVASATGFAVGQVAKVDSEEVLLQAQNPDQPLEFTVSRGFNGTTAVAHNTGAPIASGRGPDFPGAVPQADGVPVYSYAAAGPITVAEGIHELGGAGTAMTLANPSVAQDGLKMTIVARAATGYVVTPASPFTGVLAGASATFGGAIGDNMVIVARGGLWVTLAIANIT